MAKTEDVLSAVTKINALASLKFSRKPFSVKVNENRVTLFNNETSRF